MLIACIYRDQMHWVIILRCHDSHFPRFKPKLSHAFWQPPDTAIQSLKNERVSVPNELSTIDLEFKTSINVFLANNINSRKMVGETARTQNPVSIFSWTEEGCVNLLLFQVHSILLLGISHTTMAVSRELVVHISLCRNSWGHKRLHGFGWNVKVVATIVSQVIARCTLKSRTNDYKEWFRFLIARLYAIQNVCLTIPIAI